MQNPPRQIVKGQEKKKIFFFCKKVRLSGLLTVLAQSGEILMRNLKFFLEEHKAKFQAAF